jgi:cytochrome c biogenesis protein CcmG/thiol:disulfide interchange protein DsbE
MSLDGQPGRKPSRWMLLFVAAAVVVGAVRWHGPHQTPGLIPVAQRQVMRDLTLPQLDGAVWKLADHRGHVVLINYFATWCEPCRDELPALLQSVSEATPQELSAVGISLDSGPKAHTAVQQYATLYRVPYTIAFPDATISSESVNTALPTTVLIDQQGRIARTYTGEVDHATLGKDIAALLAER